MGWIQENEFDSDGIDDDVLDGKEHSNLFIHLSNIGASKFFHFIQETEEEKAYSFGHRYSYSSPNKRNYVVQKYKTLYDELMNNSIFSISKPLFKSIEKKAMKK